MPYPLWTVRRHPSPTGRQHPFLWRCNYPGCRTSGPAVSEAAADRIAAAHLADTHPSG